MAATTESAHLATKQFASDVTPEQVIDRHVGVVKEIVMRLIAQNDGFRKREIDLNTRLTDALERVYELETKGREKDTIIEELREMNRPRSR